MYEMSWGQEGRFPAAVPSTRMRNLLGWLRLGWLKIA